MKTYAIILSLSTVFLLAENSFGQQPDNKSTKTKLIESKLGIDTARAAQVFAIQTGYKSALKAVLSNSSLSETDKRAKIDKLIADKNNQLESILTPEQADRFIPTTERKRVTPLKLNSADSINRLKYVAFLKKDLAIDDQKARAVETILHNYNQGVTKVVAAGNMSDAQKRNQIEQLKSTKSQQLATILNNEQLDKIISERKINSAAAQNALHNKVQSSAEIAIRKDFVLKAKLLFADTLLSKQVKDERLRQLVKDRNDQILKCWNTNTTSTQTSTTVGKKQ